MNYQFEIYLKENIDSSRLIIEDFINKKEFP